MHGVYRMDSFFTLANCPQDVRHCRPVLLGKAAGVWLDDGRSVHESDVPLLATAILSQPRRHEFSGPCCNCCRELDHQRPLRTNLIIADLRHNPLLSLSPSLDLSHAQTHACKRTRNHTHPRAHHPALQKKMYTHIHT